MAGPTRLYLHSEPAFVGLSRYTSSSDIAENATTPCNMAAAPSNVHAARIYNNTPSGDVFLGSWVSPALKAQTLTTPQWTFFVGARALGSAVAGKLKHFLYVLRAGAYQATAQTLATDDRELYLLTGTAGLDQEYADTNYDSLTNIGSASANLYQGQGFTVGEVGTGKRFASFSAYLWRNLSPTDNIVAHLRGSIAGSNIASVSVAASAVTTAVGSSSVDQSYDPGTGVGTGAYGSTWLLQSWKPAVNRAIVDVDLKLQRSGSPSGNVEVAIRDAKSGSDLATASMSAGSVSTSMTVYTFTFSTKPYLLSGTEYYIVLRVPSGDASNFVYWNANIAGSYSNGSGWNSSNSGASWTEISGGTYDFYFTERSAAPTPGWINFDFPDVHPVAQSDQLYVVLTRSGAADSANHVKIGYDSAGTYAGSDNFRRYSSDGSSWTDASGEDVIFRTYVAPEPTQFMGRRHATVGSTITLQDGDRIVYECLATASGGGLEIGFGGLDALTSEDETAYLRNAVAEPASFVECDQALSFLWNDLLAKPDLSVLPIVDFQSAPRFVASYDEITNINAPIAGCLHAISGLSRSIGDEQGNYSVSDVSATIADAGGELKTLLAAPDTVGNTKTMIGRTCIIYLLLRSGSLMDYREIFRGRVYEITRNNALQAVLRIKSDFGITRSTPATLINYADFPNTPTANVGKPVPVIYGVVHPSAGIDSPAADQAGGVPCTQIDATAYKYLATADYYVSVDAVYKDNSWQDPSTQYTVTRQSGLSFGDGYAAIIDMVSNPGSSVISVQMTGPRRLPTSSAAQMNQPIEVIQHYLLNHAGLKETQLDLVKWSHIKGRAADTIGSVDQAQDSYASSEVMGQNAGDLYWSQTFKPSFSGTLSKVRVVLRKYGSPADNIKIAIRALAGTTDLAYATMAGSSLTSSAVWYDFTMSADLDALKTYRIIFTRSGSVDASNYYGIYDVLTTSTIDYYKPGSLEYGSDGSSWSFYPGDAAFQVYMIATSATGYPTRGITISGSIINPTTLQTLLTEWAQNFDCDFYLTTAGQLGVAFADFAGCNTPAMRFSDYDIGDLQESFSSSAYADTMRIKWMWDAVGAAYDENLSNESDMLTTTMHLGQGTGTNQKAYISQKFAPTMRIRLDGVHIGLGKTGSPADNVYVDIYTLRNVGLGTRLQRWTVAAASIPYSGTLVPTAEIILEPNTDYYVICSRSGALDASNYYMVTGGASSGTWGESQESTDGIFWTGEGETMQLSISATVSTGEGIGATVTKVIEGKWIRTSTTAQKILIEATRKKTPPQPLFLDITLPLKALALELGDVIEIDHHMGEGRGYRRFECQVRQINYDFGATVKLRCRSNDIFDGALAYDDNIGAASWPSGSDEDKFHLYACDDDTGCFSDGAYGKGCYSNASL